jgi:nucleoid-associated protein YgaU
MISSARLRLAVAVGVFLTAPTALAAQNSRPDTHTVRSGDTLWDLAKQYLGDPFLWPEIYRLNTNVVEDPHWIYPGEVLRLGGGPEVSSVPSTETPPPVEAGPPPAAGNADAAAAEAAPSEEQPAAAGLAEPQVGDLAANDAGQDSGGDVDMTPLVGSRSRAAQTGPSLELSLSRRYRPIRRTEFYSSGFLTEEQALPFGTVLGTVTPLQIEEVSNRSTAQMYARIAVVPPAGGKYQVGDTLLTAFLRDGPRGYGSIVVPTGLVRIVDVSRPENVAEVIATYGSVRNQQRVLPAEKFNDPGNVHPVPISDGVKGALLSHRDQQPLTGPQDVVFLDKGRKDGVTLGDLFEIRQTPRARPGAATVVNDVMATVQVVHVGDRTATARVVSVVQPDIRPGAEARQIAKLPS